MPRKKSNTQINFSKNPIKQSEMKDSDSNIESKRTLEAIESNRQQILEMQNRILSVPAMNGGFSNLMYKIEKIEQSQSQLVTKVDEIREVLYDPDNGLYARIKSVENGSAELERVQELEEQLHSIQNWKISEEKIAQKEELNDENIAKIINQHSEVIKELQTWHQKQAAATKWLSITIGTAILGTIGKLIHAYISSHIQII
jgi:vacuolar-type H+-ATPase subunit I/STV1